jgi:hypothetical protein
MAVKGILIDGVEGSDSPATAVQSKLSKLSKEATIPNSINTEDSSFSLEGNVF